MSEDRAMQTRTSQRPDAWGAPCQGTPKGWGTGGAKSTAPFHICVNFKTEVYVYALNRKSNSNCKPARSIDNRRYAWIHTNCPFVIHGGRDIELARVESGKPTRGNLRQ